MKKTLFTLLFGLIATIGFAQTFIKEESDTTVMCEYLDDHLWAYRHIGDFVVGMTNYEAKDDYGKYYQIVIFIKNLSDENYIFDPDKVESILYQKQGKELYLQVYTYNEYMKKVKNAQAWSMALLGLSAGINAGNAGYQTTYTTTYGAGGLPYTQVSTTYNYANVAALNMASTTQMMTLGKLMDDERNNKSQGYLKKTTIHPQEGLIGYMNIKRKRGEKMRVTIPFGYNVFSFDWSVAKK